MPGRMNHDELRIIPFKEMLDYPWIYYFIID
jgi:hypothetical protein